LVNTLSEWAKKLFSSPGPEQRNEVCETDSHVELLLQMDDSKQKKKQHNGFPEYISKVILPYTSDLGESLKRILEKHRNEISSNLQLNHAQS